MQKGIIGRKVGMTQIFDEKGNVVPVTVIEAGPCPVTQVKTVEKDGYNALQIALTEAKEKHVGKAMRGHFAKAGAGLFRHTREIRLQGAPIRVISVKAKMRSLRTQPVSCAS